MNKKAFAGLFLLIVIAAAAIRLAGLGLRPMHHDEANQALKFGVLLENGDYRYDKADHHGPSLYYLTLPFARALGADTLAALKERDLRLVPACFGIGAVLLLLLFVPLIGKEAALWSALGMAASPVMVYFSRFYIQETLLLFFLAAFIAAVLRYRRRQSWVWALAAGFFGGMMYATKETSVIAFGSIAAAWLLASLFKDRSEGTERKADEARDAGGSPAAVGRPFFIPRQHVPIHLLIGFGTAIIVSILLFTSFFQNPRGWLDSILSFKVYFTRAGEAGFHAHPWHYYIKTLLLSKSGTGPVWSEGLILILAAAGIAVAFRKRQNQAALGSTLRFLVFYAVFSTAAYSLIPYKTPWNILPFYLGLIILSGIGAAALLKAFRSRPARAVFFLLLAAGFLHLCAQARRASFVYPSDPRNPYVYAQTTPGFLQLVKRVEGLSAVHPDHEKMGIKVIAGPYETWPLPWYLRRFTRVGYWQDASAAGPPEDAPIIISDARQAESLESRLYPSFQSEYYELRPNVFLILSVRADLWEEYLKSRSGK